MDAIAQSRGFGKNLVTYFETKMRYLKEDNGKEGRVGLGWGRIVNRSSIEELEKRIATLQERK